MKNSGDLTLTPGGEREIVRTRIFDAPRDRLFEPLTPPELIKRWLLGPPGRPIPVCEVDLKVGGAYRYVWRHTNGNEMAMGGIYREIARPTPLSIPRNSTRPGIQGRR